MNPSSDHDPSDQDKGLERLIGDTLREQPLRRAPATLASRVLREIEARATTPWWRMNFARWPMAAQTVFLIASVAIVKFAVDASMWLMNRLDSVPVATDVVAAVAPVKTSVQTIAEVTSSVVQHIPALWIYGGISALAVLYVALFGISAAAYRTLYASR